MILNLVSRRKFYEKNENRWKGEKAEDIRGKLGKIDTNHFQDVEKISGKLVKVPVYATFEGLH